MSLRNDLVRRRLKRKGPISTVVSILTACGVTVVGLTVGLEPYTIFYRALVSAAILGCLVSFGLSVIDIANVTKQ